MVFKGLAIKTCWFWIPVLMMLFAFPNTFTYAEKLSQPSKKDLEAWEKAQDYSLAHPVITFAVYGRTEKFTAMENADRIKKFFSNQNVTSEYFLAKEDRMGASVGFYIQGVSYGPIGLAKAFPLIQKVVAHYKQKYSTAP